MPLFKKSNKSRQLSQQLVPFGIPTHIALGPLGFSADLGLNASAQGENDSPHIVLRDNSMDHRLDPSGPSDPTHGRAGGITPVHELDTSQNVPEEDPGRAAHNLRPAESPSEAPTQGVVEAEGVVTGDSPDTPPKDVSGVDHVGNDADDAIQPARSGGRDWKDRAIGGAALVFDVAKAAAEAFGPLKAALEAASTVYDQYKFTSSGFQSAAIMIDYYQRLTIIISAETNIIEFSSDF